MSKVSSLHHIVWCTKKRRKTITNQYRTDLYRFIWNEIKKRSCRLERIGGVEDHLHLLVDLNPKVSLSKLVGDVKAVTSAWMKREPKFPEFEGWAREYFASALSPSDKMSVIQYIDSQQEKHHSTSFVDELRNLYGLAQLEYDDRDMSD